MDLKSLSGLTSWDNVLMSMSHRHLSQPPFTAFDFVKPLYSQHIIDSFALQNKSLKSIASLSSMISGYTYPKIQRDYLMSSPFYSMLKLSTELSRSFTSNLQFNSISAFANSLNYRKSPALFPSLLQTGLMGYFSTLSKSAIYDSGSTSEDPIFNKMDELASSIREGQCNTELGLEIIKNVVLEIEKSLTFCIQEHPDSNESILSFNHIMDYLHLIIGIVAIVLFFLGENNSHQREANILEAINNNQEQNDVHFEAIQTRLDTIYSIIQAKHLSSCEIRTFLKKTPRNQSKILSFVRTGQIVEVIEKQKKWIRIVYVDDSSSQKQIGWALKKNFKKYCN